MRWIVIAAMMIFICGSGCSEFSEYVAADKATFEAISPEYLEYLQKDAALDDEQKERRKNLVETWRMRIEGAEQSVEQPAEEP
jgi:hypothetical protein